MEDLQKKYDEYKAMNLSLNMTRGKPCKEQLMLSNKMLDCLNSKSNFLSAEGMDVRNYGGLDGIKECKKLLADMVDAKPENVFIFGNSSLNVMYDCIARSMTHGVLNHKPWCKQGKIKFICPVPGYDRHFAILEHFGIEMINVDLKDDGPDMDAVEKLVKDKHVKGIWCVPVYSNPSGISYSDEVVRRLANLKPKAPDFRIYWDNAYVVHHLYNDKQDKVLNILEECVKANNPDLVYEFVSTSKVTFPGGGVAALVSSINNLDSVKAQVKYQTIGPDKLNQLRHVLFFKDIEGLKGQMKKHAEILRPKFEYIEKRFSEELVGLAKWTNPLGGYFVTVEVPGRAKQVVEKARELGLSLVEVGSAFPYHKDPNDSVIRLAPTCMNQKELELATEIFILSVKLCSK